MSHSVQGAVTGIQRWLLVAMLGAVAATSFALQDYRLYQLTQVLAYAIALLGLNLLTGYNGQISLGHGAFFAIGAYSAAILIGQFGVPYAVALPMAGLICFAVGVVIGLPALRLEGLYLALATFALGVTVPQILKSRTIERWTGGVTGLNLEKPTAPFHLPISPDQWLFLVAFVIAVVMFLLARNLLNSRVGSALIAIREHPLAAEAMGIDNARYKTMTFGISALYTGVAGALSALSVQFVAPDSFTSFLSLSLLVGIVVGGLGTLSGALYGALFIQFIPTLADTVSKAAPTAVYGALMLMFVFAMPAGIAGAVCSLLRFARSLSWRQPGCGLPPHKTGPSAHNNRRK